MKKRSLPLLSVVEGEDARTQIRGSSMTKETGFRERSKDVIDEDELETMLEERFTMQSQDVQNFLNQTISGINTKFKEFDDVHTGNLNTVRQEVGVLRGGLSSLQDQIRANQEAINNAAGKFQAAEKKAEHSGFASLAIPKKRAKVLAAQQKLFEQLEDIDDTYTAQVMLHKAVDQLVGELGLEGKAKKMVHMKVGHAWAAALGMAFVGAGLAATGIYVGHRVSLNRNGKTRDEYKSWKKGTSLPKTTPAINTNAQGWAAE